MLINSEKVRIRKRKRQFDENEDDVLVQTASEKFRVEVYYVILDKMMAEIKKRKDAYSEIENLFGFFTKFQKMNIEEIKLCCERLVLVYKNDLEPKFTNEFIGNLYVFIKI